MTQTHNDPAADEAAAVEALLRENVDRGLMTMGVSDGGSPTFSMTDAGRAYVESMGTTTRAPALDSAPSSPRMDIGQAITAMRRGERVARAGWNGKGMWLALQTPDENSKMGKPYIYMRPVDGELVPWLASQTDLLATDWQTVAEAPAVREHVIVIHGASDDLIEVEGAVSLEGGHYGSAAAPVLVDGNTVADVTYNDHGIWRITPDPVGMARAGLTWEHVEPYGEDGGRRETMTIAGVTLSFPPGYSEFLAVRGAFSTVEVGGDRGSVTA